MTTPHLQRLTIPSGYRGTLATLSHIADLIRRGAKDFVVRRQAVAILRGRGVRAKDYLAEIKSLFEWVQSHVRYTRDTYRVELLHSPRRMLELRAGDCDDMTILLGALLESVGHPVRLVITGSDPARPTQFSHIYLQVCHRGRWIALDATMPHPMGWQPATPVKQIVTLRRNPDMQFESPESLGAATDPANRLQNFIRALRGEAIPPRDARVKMLWELLRRRQLLARDLWLKAVLRRIWEQGLSARPRPRTSARVVQSLRRWDLLPPAAGATGRPLAPGRQRHPVPLRPVARGPRPARPSHQSTAHRPQT